MEERGRSWELNAMQADQDRHALAFIVCGQRTSRGSTDVLSGVELAPPLAATTRLPSCHSEELVARVPPARSGFLPNPLDLGVVGVV